MAGNVAKKGFYQDFCDFMEKHKLADWAFVGRSVDSDMVSLWDAGTGSDQVSDRERIDVLSAELDRLKMSMLLHSTPTERA